MSTFISDIQKIQNVKPGHVEVSGCSDDYSTSTNGNFLWRSTFFIVEQLWNVTKCIYFSSPALLVLFLLLNYFSCSRKLLACSALLSKKTMKSFGRFLEGSQEVLHQTHKRSLDLDSWIWNSWVYTHINALTQTNLNLYILEKNV